METSTTSLAAETNAALAAQNATTRGFDEISTEDFFALMVEELRSQDPLDPKDNQQLLQQMSNIQQLEQSSTLTKTLEALTNEQRFGSTANLIGNYVLGTVTDSAGLPTDIDGLVVGVSFEGNGNAVLNLHDGRAIPAKNIREVTLVENLPPDILAELEAELDQIASGNAAPPVDGATDGATDDTAGDGAADDGTANDAAAKAIAAGRSRTPDREAAWKLLDKIRTQRAEAREATAARDFQKGVNVVGELINSVFSPGVSAGISG